MGDEGLWWFRHEEEACVGGNSIDAIVLYIDVELSEIRKSSRSTDGRQRY